MDTLSSEAEVIGLENEANRTETALVKTDATNNRRRHGQGTTATNNNLRPRSNPLKKFALPLIIVFLLLGLFLTNASYSRQQQDMLARFEQLQAINSAQMERIATENAEIMNQMLRQQEENIARERQQRIHAEERLETYREDKWKAREDLELERQKQGYAESWNKLSNRQKVTVATAGAAGMGSVVYYGRKAAEWVFKGHPAVGAASKLLPVAVNYVANMVVYGG